MKAGLTILAGLLITDGISTNININATGCKVEKAAKDQFSCPCTGGSGNYDWHYTNLPQGWESKDDKIIAPKGKFQDRKVYGAKVQVFDKNTKESVKKSLFFSFENGRVGQIAEHDYDFDCKKLVNVQPKNNTYGVVYGNQNGKNTDADEKVKKLFEGVDGIGGGCGLIKLRPYFVGSGLYKGDDKNPFRDQLPTDNDVDKVVNAGKSKDIRDVVVNAARSKAPCKDINNFLQRLFERLRNKIGHAKDDVNKAKKFVSTLQQQIKSLQAQLKDAQANGASAASLFAQLQQFKLDSAKAIETKAKYQVDLKKTTTQLDDLQKQLYTFVRQNQNIKARQNKRQGEANKIDKQIASLQAQIKKLKDNKQSVFKAGEADKKALEQSDKKISDTNTKIEAAKITANDLRAKIKAILITIDSLDAKISDTEKSLKATDRQQRVDGIKIKIAQIQKKIDASNADLKNAQPDFKDLQKNYNDLQKVREDNFNGCYKNVFGGNKDNDDFKQNDNDDNLQFDGKIAFEGYCQKIFGNVVAKKVLNVRIDDALTNAVNQEQDNDDDNKKIKVTRSNLFTNQWKQAYGDVLDDDDDNDDTNQGGHKFDQQDFQCDCLSTATLKSYKARIIKINKNIARVIDEQNVQTQVYFGGCSRIQVVDKKIPKAGDQIVFKGAQRKGEIGSYNAHHAVCR